MTTRETVGRFFEALSRHNGWESFIADDVNFSSFTTPIKRVSGRAAVLQALGKFYASTERVEMRELIVDADRACALTRYRVRPTNGAPPFDSDVAEIFTVRRGQITDFAIYFDTAPYPT